VPVLGDAEGQVVSTPEAAGFADEWSAALREYWRTAVKAIPDTERIWWVASRPA
jgi:hypothetical protein